MRYPIDRERITMARLFSWALALGLLLFVPIAAASAHGNGTFYIDPSQVDLDHLLAPPPALGSAAETQDLAAVVAAEANRTADQAVAAEEDHDRTVFRFADVMGPGFTPQNLPFATKFFQRVFSDQNKIVHQAKIYFDRPRPFVVDSNLTPMISAKPTPSYPSGHTTFAYVMAILLANMVPEKAVPIFDRAAAYGYNRVVAGAHFPTDVEAGRIAATVIDSVFFHEPRFMTDFVRARAEIRQALKLPPVPAARP
jgi:acid phosphatase (class A)